MATTTPTPVNTGTATTTVSGPPSRAPAAVAPGPGTTGTVVTAPTPIGPPETAPPAVTPGPGTGQTTQTTATVTVPVTEVPVDTAGGGGGNTVVIGAVPNYIEVLADGSIIVQNAAALNFTGTGVSITANGSVATLNITSGGNLTKIENGTSYANIPTANGNVTISSAGQIWTFATNGTLSAAGNITTTANISGGNVLIGGVISATGNITGGNLTTTGTANVASLAVTGSATVQGSISIFSTSTSLSATGNVIVGNALTGGLISATGNITGGNLSGTSIVGTLITAAQTNITSVGTLGALTVTGNATGGNILTGGLISVTGNITGGNINTGGKILGNYTFSQSGATSAYATKRVLQYVEGTGVVTYSNYIDASSIYITGYAIEIHVSPSALDDSGNGTIGTPVKTIARAQVLAAEAFETSSAGQRKTIVLHPGDYVENVTISTQFTVLTTHELVGKNTTLSGTLTITKGCTIDGLKMTNLVISADNTTGSVDIIGCTVTTAVTKTSSAYTVFRGCDISSATLSITGTGSTVLVGGNYFTLTVNNASAGVLAKSVVTMGPVTLTAGTVQLSDTLIYAAANTSNAITQSAGSVITVNNCQTLIPDLTNVARNSFGGFYSILNAVYDKGNSTFSGTSLNSIVYSQYINADRLTIGELISATGNITGGNLLTGGLISATGNITGGNVLGGANVNATTHTGTTVSVSANITGGNLLTGGLISATGNVNVGNLINAGLTSVTGNITGGNILTGGLISATGNITGGNVLGGANVNATTLTGTTVSVSANITGGNILTGGLISATGNITGGNVLFGSGVVSGTGNITGGNILTGGLISATGNISGGNLIVTGIVVDNTANLDLQTTATNGNINLITAGTGIVATTASFSATGNITGGNLAILGNTATITTANISIGYLNIPQISLSANVTANLTVSGKHYYSTSASNLALTLADNSVASWPVGTAISVINRGTANVTVAPAAGVSLYLAGNSTSANRVVTTYGMATVMNVAANIWMINGTVV